MPIYMDLHLVPGITAKMAAEAHFEDHNVQDDFGCKCLTYWIDEDKERAFCLIDAPNKEAINRMHNKAYGGKPDLIIEVSKDEVKGFLGRVNDPETLIDFLEPDIKVFNDPAFRIILVANILDKILLQSTYGKEKASKLLEKFKEVFHEQISKYEGNKASSYDESIIASFTLPSTAIKCSLAIQKELSLESKDLNLNLGLHAGMPVNKGGELFEDVVNFGKFLCTINRENEIITSPIIYEMYKEEYKNIVDSNTNFRAINSAEGSFLESLLQTLSENWNNSKFKIADFNSKMGMSKSQLYRRSKNIIGNPPNAILLEYRLLNSLKFLKRADYDIAQTAFDSGFSSPSYFTKCFRKRFGIQPTEYKQHFI